MRSMMIKIKSGEDSVAGKLLWRKARCSRRMEAASRSENLPFSRGCWNFKYDLFGE